MIRRREPIGCPRDKSLLREATLGDAVVDVCGRCFGTFFESGELFVAAGIPADPSSWDRGIARDRRDAHDDRGARSSGLRHRAHDRWLEIENLSSEERRLDKLSIAAGRFHLPVSRWYEEGTAGEPWGGTLKGRAKVRLNVIGYFDEAVKPGTAIDATVTLGPLATRIHTAALADIHFD